MKVNDEIFKIYKLDTINTIIDRIAYKQKTLPKYLYFPDGVPENKDIKNIKVEDLLKTIRKYINDIVFKDLYYEIRDKLDQQSLSIETDIIPLFIFYNTILSDADQREKGSILLVLQNELNDLKIKVDVYEIDKKIDNILEDINKNTDILKEKVNKQVELFKQYENIEKGVEYSEFYLEKAKIELELDIENVGLMEIFNNIKLNKNIPFATINNFYKIYKEFIPPTDWSMSFDNVIILKVLSKKSSSNFEDYTDVYIIIDKRDDIDKIVIGITLDISGQNITKDDFINNIMSLFEGTNISIAKETKVNGLFFFPLQRMNKFILADLIMNNELFSSIMVIDEHEKASKSKDSVYIYFYNEELGEITANITEKIATKQEIDIRKNKKLFPLNEYYTRIKVTKASNQDVLNKFQDILSRLFVIYNNLKDDIIEEYKKFIPKFDEDYGQIKKKKKVEEIPNKKLKLKDIVPELFIVGYPRTCLKQPTIIEDDEVEDAIREGYQVMTFPKPGNDFGLEPKNYVCRYPDSGHKYPGLRDNPLSNKDKYPYLPCCFEVNQNDKKESYYREYFYDEKVKKKNKQQDPYITNKILPKNGSGIIPKNLENLLKIISDDNNGLFDRKGVSRTKNSLLECVIKATEHITFKKTDNIEEILNNFKIENLAKPELAVLCKQELYDRNVEEIIEMINNKEEYFNPKYFIPLLENYFKCNIFVFNRKENNAFLTLPRFEQTYYKKENKNPCIIIIEHFGAEADHAEFPQCELVAYSGNFIYEYDSTISTKLFEMFNNLKQTYKLEQKVENISFSLPKTIEIIEQKFDSYGKTRLLNIKYKEHNITLLTDPMCPINVIENENAKIYKIDYTILSDLLPLMKFISSGQIKEDDVIKELIGVIGNVSISIPILDREKKIPIIPIIDKPLSYSFDRFSYLELYNNYKKLSKYLIEYTYWLYSKYLSEIGSDDVDSLDNISAFVEKYIEIDPEFKYKKISKKFLMKSNIMKNNKLVVTSEEVQKRLIYMLREYSIRHSRELLNYKDKKIMEGYYIDINSFDKNYDEIILQGNNSISKWNEDMKNKYNLKDRVETEEISPYFFKNDIINKNKIFLAQNTDTIEKALYISEEWYINNYNSYNNIPEDIKKSKSEFVLYSYKNETDIKQYLIKGKKVEYKIRIIGYKKDDKTLFTVLLEL